jgi:hypothetical protein
MEIIAGVIELKPNSMDNVEQWAETINARIDEAIATLQDEGVQLESWFHLPLDGKDYLLSYMRAESLQKAQKVVTQSEHAIDAYHQTFKQETWLRGTRARLLVDLVNDTAS